MMVKRKAGAWRTLMAAMLMAAVAFAFAACGSASDEAEDQTVGETTQAAAEETTAEADPADGWQQVATAAEAARGAGNMDEFEVPAQLVINDMTFTDPKFSYQDGVAQAYYESGAVGVSIRKAGGIYGGPITDRDTESFPKHWAQQVGDDANDVAECYGMEEGSAIVAQWSEEEDFYSVTSQGLGGEEYGMDAATVARLQDEID